MSLTTRCPTCQTLFKVVPDQLRIAGGWVRCGQCQAAFDAKAALLGDAPTPAMSEPAPDFNDALQTGTLSGECVPKADHDGDTEPDAPTTVAAAAPLIVPAGSLEAETADAMMQSVPVTEAAAADETPARNEIEALVPEIAADEVSFLRQPNSDSSPSRPLASAVFVLCNLALMLVLLGQIVLHERDRLAAYVPALTPWLRQACGFANCTLSPLRSINSIVIESSSFVKIEDGIYGLNFTLKNAGATELALPAVELTLTNALDQPVLRRVLRSAEWGAKSDRLAVGLEWPVTLTLALNGTSSISPPVGYRLLAFYP